MRLQEIMGPGPSPRRARLIGIAIGTVVELLVSVLIPGSNYIVELVVALLVGIIGGVAWPGKLPKVAYTN
jgi:hypothetical protein